MDPSDWGKYELEQLGGQISALETKKKELEETLLDATISIDKMTEVSKELGAVINELDEKEMRWLELSEMAE